MKHTLYFERSSSCRPLSPTGAALALAGCAALLRGTLIMPEPRRRCAAAWKGLRCARARCIAMLPLWRGCLAGGFDSALCWRCP